MLTSLNNYTQQIIERELYHEQVTTYPSQLLSKWEDDSFKSPANSPADLMNESFCTHEVASNWESLPRTTLKEVPN